MEKEDIIHIYIHNRILLSHQKELKMPFAATQMGLESSYQVTETKDRCRTLLTRQNLNRADRWTYKIELKSRMERNTELRSLGDGAGTHLETVKRSSLGNCKPTSGFLLQKVPRSEWLKMKFQNTVLPNGHLHGDVETSAVSLRGESGREPWPSPG